MRGKPTPVNPSTFDTDSEDNSMLTITVVAVAGVTHVLKWLSWSFSAAPASAAALTVTIDGVPVWRVYITEGGPGQKLFPKGLYGSENEVLLVVLEASGTGGVTSCVNICTV